MRFHSSHKFNLSGKSAANRRFPPRVEIHFSVPQTGATSAQAEAYRSRRDSGMLRTCQSPQGESQEIGASRERLGCDTNHA
jgi:hypothetical protein